MPAGRSVAALSLALASVACAARQRPQPPARGETEGAVYVYVQPLPDRAGGLSFSVEGAAAERADGSAVPLRVRGPARIARAGTRQRLLAAGDAPAGRYAGLRLTLSRNDPGAPEEPFLVPAPFAVAERRATVLWLSVRDEQVAAQASLPSLLALAQAHEAIPERAGAVVSAGSNDAVLFDVLRKQVTGALLLDAAPGGVALDPVARRLYVSLPERDELRSYDLATGERRDVARLRPGDGPGPVALAAGGAQLLVANAGSQTVSLVDASSLVERARLPVGLGPVSILVNAAGTRAFVFNRRSSTATVVDVPNAAVAGTLATDPEPLLGALDRTGTRLAVVCAGSLYASVLSVPELAPVQRLFVGLGASAVQVDARTGLLYVARPEGLGVFGQVSPLPIGAISAAGRATRLRIEDADGTLLAMVPEAGALEVVDLAAGRSASRVELVGEPVDFAIAGERR